jgi:hypothetical protein
MDENLLELENELTRLHPQALPARLKTRLQRELDAPPPSRRYTTATSLRSWKWAGWSMVAAVVVTVGFFGVGPIQPSPVAPTEVSAAAVSTSSIPTPLANRYEPVRASSVLYDMKDDGLAVLPDNTQARQVRYRYVDTYTWKNPATKASLKWNVPRDEVRLVQANLD